MEPTYNVALVWGSLVLAVFASFVGLSLASRIPHVKDRFLWYWGLSGSVSMGLGIWAMHFVGMLAFHLSIPVSYDIGLTALSAVMAICTSALALYTARTGKESEWAFIIATLLMATGIAGMHYTGIAAMKMAPPIQYDAFLVLVSLSIAIVASYVALKLGFSVGKEDSFSIFSRSRVFAATIMGIGIAGMHYVGMAAANFSPDSYCTTGETGIEAGLLSLLIVTGVIFMMILTLIFLMVDLKLADMDQKLLRSLQKKNQELQKARAEAELANRAKGEFLTNMSHEMRTPMHAILSFSSIGKTRIDTASSEKLSTYFSNIHQSGERLLSLINNLLDISNLESGNMKYHFREHSLEAIVNTSLKQFSELLNDKTLKLEVIAPTFDTTVPVDLNTIIQVVSNLVSNAIKFSQPGKGISILFVETELPSAQENSENSPIPAIQVIISDEGIGIPSDELDKIFDKFIQSSRTDQDSGGTGLGLAICKDIIEAHGGTISAAKNPKGGATFSFTIPQNSEIPRHI